MARKRSRRRRRRSSRHRRSRHHRKGRRSRRGGRRAQRGGYFLGRLYPAPAFPPGGDYKPGSSTNGLGGGRYYGKLQKPCLPDPASSNRIVPLKNQGGGRRRKGRKRRTRRRRRGGKRRTRAQRGGFHVPGVKTTKSGQIHVSDGKYMKEFGIPLWEVVEVVPGGTDVRDVMWGTQAGLKNVWNTWWGNAPVNSPNPSVQPIEVDSNIVFNPSPDLDVVQRNASEAAAKYRI